MFNREESNWYCNQYRQKRKRKKKGHYKFYAEFKGHAYITTRKKNKIVAKEENFPYLS